MQACVDVLERGVLAAGEGHGPADGRGGLGVACEISRPPPQQHEQAVGAVGVAILEPAQRLLQPHGVRRRRRAGHVEHDETVKAGRQRAAERVGGVRVLPGVLSLGAHQAASRRSAENSGAHERGAAPGWANTANVVPRAAGSRDRRQAHRREVGARDHPVGERVLGERDGVVAGRVAGEPGGTHDRVRQRRCAERAPRRDGGRRAARAC